MDPRLEQIFPIAFPVFFVAMWMVVTTLLGTMSGWYALQRAFPDRQELARLTLRMRSGRMGLGVNMGGILTLAACPTGLRVGIFRLFGPFQRPFLVPWEQIQVERRTSFFLVQARLGFGRPEVGTLTIDARLWQRLAAESTLRAALPEVAPTSVKRAGLGFLVLWLAITAFAATFFYLTSRGWPNGGVPLGICIAFPGTFFGIAMLIRFLRQVR